MTDTAAKQLRRILQVIPEIADGNEHSLGKVARKAGVDEAVLIADCDNGNRFETYIIPGEPGSGIIGINGAAARLTRVGNKVIIMAFVHATPEEVRTHRSRVIIADENNRVADTIDQPTAPEEPWE